MQVLLFWASAWCNSDCCYLPRFCQNFTAIPCPPVLLESVGGFPGCAMGHLCRASTQVTKTASKPVSLGVYCSVQKRRLCSGAAVSRAVRQAWVSSRDNV